MRRRYRQDRVTGQLVEVTGRTRHHGPAIQPDIEPFTSPVDGSVIGSRRELRAHNEQHDVRLHAEYGEGDGRAYFERAQQERVRRMAGATRRDREERLRSIIPIVEANER